MLDTISILSYNSVRSGRNNKCSEKGFFFFLFLIVRLFKRHLILIKAVKQQLFPVWDM